MAFLHDLRLLLLSAVALHLGCVRYGFDEEASRSIVPGPTDSARVSDAVDSGASGSDASASDLHADSEAVPDCVGIARFDDGTASGVAALQWTAAAPVPPGVRFQACVGSTPGQCNVADWVDATSDTGHTFWDLKLTNHATYYGNLRVLGPTGTPCHQVQGDGFVHQVRVKQIMRAWHSSCALLSNLTVKCWGKNWWGQLGIESTTSTGSRADSIPSVQASNLGMPVLALSAQTNAYCALSPLGQVKCWGGDNGNPMVGTLGLEHNLAIGDEPGEMGDNLSFVNLGTGLHAQKIASGGNHTCAVFDDGRLKCWGGNESGQLGYGHTNTLGNEPGEMGDNLPFVDLGPGRRVSHLCGGGSFTCVLLDNKELKCWGNNGSGRLGLGHTATIGDEPGEMGAALPAVDLGSASPVELACGSEFACAVLDDGTLKCWGNNSFGQLGQGHTATMGDKPGEMGAALPPVDLGPGFTPRSIYTLFEAVCAVDDTGTAKCWGNNSRGQLLAGHKDAWGDGPSEMGARLPVIRLNPGRTVRIMGTWGYSACAVLDDQTIRCWGYNGTTWGILGIAQNVSDWGGSVTQVDDKLPVVPLPVP